jgi:hypothetical protein
MGSYAPVGHLAPSQIKMKQRGVTTDYSRCFRRRTFRNFATFQLVTSIDHQSKTLQKDQGALLIGCVTNAAAVDFTLNKAEALDIQGNSVCRLQ